MTLKEHNIARARCSTKCTFHKLGTLSTPILQRTYCTHRICVSTFPVSMRFQPRANAYKTRKACLATMARIGYTGSGNTDNTSFHRTSERGQKLQHIQTRTRKLKTQVTEHSLHFIGLAALGDDGTRRERRWTP